MLFDPTDARDFLSGLAQSPPTGPWPAGAPVSEYLRSPAAARTAQLAVESGLFLFNYEHRCALDLPEDFIPAGSADLVEPPGWHNGILLEHKYHSFRHELVIGGFHPGHRAKWSSHELCHELGAFAYKPGASPLFIATAARLAELVPVLLYYFLDEAFLRRCPAHQGGGALFRTLCPECESVASMVQADPDALHHLQQGRRFLDRELAAIAKTRRSGVPVSHQWATLDLCSDGLTYAAAHGPRLQSDTWQQYADRFLSSGAGHSDLDALEERVVAVANALVGGELSPHTPTPEQGSWLWKLQDVGWRLTTVWHQTEGEAAQTLDGIVEQLAAAVSDPAGQAAAALERAASSYIELHDEWQVPAPEHVFAVGYDLPMGGHDVEQLAAGVQSALAVTAKVLGDGLLPLVEQWSTDAVPVRARIGTRFVQQLQLPGALQELAEFEAAVGSVPGRDVLAASLGTEGERYRLSATASVLSFSRDVVDLLEGTHSAEVLWTEQFDPVQANGAALPPQPTHLVVGADPLGQLTILDVRAQTADTLRNIGPEGIEVEGTELQALRELGVLVPVSWPT